jgi:hypothetical protein
VEQYFASPARNQYKRFCYWLECEEFSRLVEAVGNKFVLHRAQKAFCEPLRRDVQIGYALPNVWNILCRRQSSWYRASAKANKILLVSAFELGEYGLEPETMIFDSRFRPPLLPGLKEQMELVQLKRYTDMRPDEWEQITEADEERIIRHARGMGIRDSLDQILLSRSANHANFLEPRYYLREAEHILPYSIGKSGNVCSACLQFFNIIGSEFRTKLVVPCAGAVIYAGMRVNRYYEVRSLTPPEPASSAPESLHP